MEKETQKSIAKCIDISYWQGKISVENFKKVKADGIVRILSFFKILTNESFLDVYIYA